MKIKIILLILSCFFSSFLYAETITVISTPPTIDGVQGTPTQNTLIRAKGKVIKITAKPKVGFKGVIKIDGEIISTSKINSVVKHIYTIVSDVTIEIIYSAANKEYQKTFVYDSANRVVTEDFGNGQSIEYVYDDSGNLIQQKIVR